MAEVVAQGEAWEPYTPKPKGYSPFRSLEETPSPPANNPPRPPEEPPAPPPRRAEPTPPSWLPPAPILAQPLEPLPLEPEAVAGKSQEPGTWGKEQERLTRPWGGEPTDQSNARAAVPDFTPPPSPPPTWRLVGLLRGAASVALIVEEDGRRHLLREGMRLGPYVVEHIGRDHLTLRRGEERQVMWLGG
ncbi:MAG TPA: hypothetical protein EYP85_06975 [Armatimonadetes bacterium]|nr:hypothetical protein [Armatimonadota bacterium]